MLLACPTPVWVWVWVYVGQVSTDENKYYSYVFDARGPWFLMKGATPR